MSLLPTQQNSLQTRLIRLLGHDLPIASIRDVRALVGHAPVFATLRLSVCDRLLCDMVCGWVDQSNRPLVFIYMVIREQAKSLRCLLTTHYYCVSGLIQKKKATCI